MNSMNARLKGFGLGSKRKSTANQSSTPQQAASAPNPQLTGRPGPPSIASNSTASLPMNQQQMGGQRPPSYSPGYPPGVTGIQQGRIASPQVGNPRTPPAQMMGGPPPINTASGGYPPGQHQQNMGGPPQMQQGIGGPPQYGGAPYPQQGGDGMAPAPYPVQQQRGNAVEVEGAGRSKSQLIVGIDFVSVSSFADSSSRANDPIGNHFLWRRIRIRVQ